MSLIKDWGILDLTYHEQRHNPYVPPEVDTSKSFQLPTAKDVTLAEFDPSSQGLITAHRIRDYRRTHFTLILLPDIEIEVDAYTAPLEIAEGPVL